MAGTGHHRGEPAWTKDPEERFRLWEEKTDKSKATPYRRLAAWEA